VASGCGSCHTISGVDGADGKIGPSLAGVAERRTIAGRLENTPQNLTLWIREPQRVDPGNLMPGLGLSEADARDIAAYLDRH
jgi:cytochrome c2